MKPILFYTVGYPGAGKTTLARSLATLLGGEHVRGDRIGFELFHFPTFSPAERQAVHAEMQRRSGAALDSGRVVLYDAAANARGQREQLVALARAHGVPAIGVWVQTPLELAQKRAGSARDAGVFGALVRVIPPPIFRQYVAAFEAPVADERIIRVAGDSTFSLQYRRLQRQLAMHGVPLPRLIQ